MMNTKTLQSLLIILLTEIVHFTSAEDTGCVESECPAEEPICCRPFTSYATTHYTSHYCCHPDHQKRVTIISFAATIVILAFVVSMFAYRCCKVHCCKKCRRPTRSSGDSEAAGSFNVALEMNGASSLPTYNDVIGEGGHKYAVSGPPTSRQTPLPLVLNKGVSNQAYHGDDVDIPSPAYVEVETAGITS